MPEPHLRRQSVQALCWCRPGLAAKPVQAVTASGPGVSGGSVTWTGGELAGSPRPGSDPWVARLAGPAYGVCETAAGRRCPQSRRPE